MVPAPYSAGVLAPLITDLDGVLRLWDPNILTSAEARHGLPTGALRTAVLDDSEALRAATTGEVSDQQWRAGIGQRLRDQYGERAVRAVRDWAVPAGEVNVAVLTLVRRERARGRPVAILSNATDRLARDLRQLRLDVEVDAVLNSSELRVAKPDPEAFRRAAWALKVPVSECLFVDDSAQHVEAAATLGMAAHKYVGPDALAAFLDRQTAAR